jgi:hypothetical protein
MSFDFGARIGMAIGTVYESSDASPCGELHRDGFPGEYVKVCKVSCDEGRMLYPELRGAIQALDTKASVRGRQCCGRSS